MTAAVPIAFAIVIIIVIIVVTVIYTRKPKKDEDEDDEDVPTTPVEGGIPNTPPPGNVPNTTLPDDDDDEIEVRAPGHHREEEPEVDPNAPPLTVPGNKTISTIVDSLDKLFGKDEEDEPEPEPVPVPAPEPETPALPKISWRTRYPQLSAMNARAMDDPKTEADCNVMKIFILNELGRQPLEVIDCLMTVKSCRSAWGLKRELCRDAGGDPIDCRREADQLETKCKAA